MNKDKRQISAVWEYCNSDGDVFRFARIGSGKNSYVKTLCYLGNVIAKPDLSSTLQFMGSGFGSRPRLVGKE